MKRDLALDYVVPFMSRIPTTLPWMVAGTVGVRENQGKQLVQWLTGVFSTAFPQASHSEHKGWARAYFLCWRRKR